MGKVVKGFAAISPVVGLVTGGLKGLGKAALNTAMIAAAYATGGPIGAALATASAFLKGSGIGRKKPKVSTAQLDRLRASIVTDTPRVIALGHTALATDERYREWWGADQQYVSRVILVASHWVESIEEIWLDDKLAWTAAGGTQGEFAGYLWAEARPQATGDNAYVNDWSGRWGANAAFAGCADVYLQFKVTGNSSKASSPFSAGVTDRITIRGKGARVYDPRRDDTAGGDGDHRIDDQETWAFADGTLELGRNLPLQLLFYLLGWRIDGKLAVGCGVPVDRIDLDSFVTAANMADEPVLKADGSYEPRYRGDGLFSEADDPLEVIAAFEAAMDGKLRDDGGKLALQLFHDDLAFPVLDLGPDDVLGDFEWKPGVPLRDRKNIVRGKYTDASDNALYQASDYPEVAVESLDGIDRVDSVDYLLVQSASQAQRLAKRRLRRFLFPGTFSASFNAKGWGVKDGQIVRLTFPPLRFVNKPFRVDLTTVDPTGVVPMQLIEEDASIYLWSAEEERDPAAAAAPLPRDPLNNPLVVAISDTAAASDVAAQAALIEAINTRLDNAGIPDN